MRSAFALRIFSGKDNFGFGVLKNLRAFQNSFFTGGIRGKGQPRGGGAAERKSTFEDRPGARAFTSSGEGNASCGKGVSLLTGDIAKGRKTRNFSAALWLEKFRVLYNIYQSIVWRRFSIYLCELHTAYFHRKFSAAFAKTSCQHSQSWAAGTCR